MSANDDQEESPSSPDVTCRMSRSPPDLLDNSSNSPNRLNIVEEDFSYDDINDNANDDEPMDLTGRPDVVETADDPQQLLLMDVERLRAPPEPLGQSAQSPEEQVTSAASPDVLQPSRSPPPDVINAPTSPHPDITSTSLDDNSPSSPPGELFIASSPPALVVDSSPSSPVLESCPNQDPDFPSDPSNDVDSTVNNDTVDVPVQSPSEPNDTSESQVVDNSAVPVPELQSEASLNSKLVIEEPSSPESKLDEPSSSEPKLVIADPDSPDANLVIEEPSSPYSQSREGTVEPLLTTTDQKSPEQSENSTEAEAMEANENSEQDDHESNDNVDASMNVDSTTQDSPAQTSSPEKDYMNDSMDVDHAEDPEINPEDLEDGELPESDEEEEDESSKPKEKPIPASILELEKKLKKSLEKEKHKEKEKEKEKEREKKKREKDKEKEKEKLKKEKKKRRHSDEENKANSKSKRKREEEVGDDTEFMYVRGVSPVKTGYDNNTETFRQEFEEPEEFDRRGHRRRGREDRPAPPGRRDVPPRREEKQKPPKIDMICTYFMQGKCQKSADDCNFSHDAVPPRKMELCKFWMMDCCAKKEKCLYLHNDFPCKYYHTGLVCKLGEKCKFSHNPLNEQTKAVLVKHIETAPKEILGDFPRLNRSGALNLINKMEGKINAQFKVEHPEAPAPLMNHHHGASHHQQQPPMHNDHDRNSRRTRWEQPTRDDQEKLHELMEEAGIGGYYNEAIEQQSHQNSQPPANQSQQQHNQPLLGQAPLLPSHMMNNPTITNALSNLNGPNNNLASQQSGNAFLPDAQFIQSLQLLNAAATAGPNGPSTQQIQQATQVIQQQLQNFQQSPLLLSPFMSALTATAGAAASQGLGTSTASPPPAVNIKTESPPSPPSDSSVPPGLDHLPKMQQELFKRIQNMQMKKEQEINEEPEAPPLDDDWYSSEDEDKEKDVDKKPDFSSVLSAIRQSANSERSRSPTNNSSTPGGGPASLKDVDLRAMPFGDTDFRLPPLRTTDSFKDIDLRSSDSASGFKKVPQIPASEIHAGLSSHAGITWKVFRVSGVRKIDYSQVRGTVQSSQLTADPRLARGGNTNLPVGPASPPPCSVMGNSSPIGIPSSSTSEFSDPRMRKNLKDSSNRQVPLGQDSPTQSSLLPNTQPQGSQSFFPPNELSPALAQAFMQAAAAAAGNPAAAAAFLPNLPGNPFLPPEFLAAAAAAAALQQQQQPGPPPRQPFHPPKSSWESRYQQGSGGVTPPL